MVLTIEELKKDRKELISSLVNERQGENREGALLYISSSLIVVSEKIQALQGRFVNFSGQAFNRFPENE